MYVLSRRSLSLNLIAGAMYVIHGLDSTERNTT